MNAMEYAIENHKRWQEVEEFARVLGHMDDLLMRMMGDVKSLAEVKDYTMAMHGLEHDVSDVLNTVYDMHIRIRLLCSEAGNQADAFETACATAKTACEKVRVA